MIKMHNIGYACMHAGKYPCSTEVVYNHRLTTGRTCRAATRNKDFESVGMKALENIQDLRRMLLWNVKHDIRCLRVSALFPWLDTYNPTHLHNWKQINEELERCHNIIVEHELRVTTHPGQYVCLASANPSVVDASVKEMNAHGLMFDLLGLTQTPWNKINIHIGGTYLPKNPSEKETDDALKETARRFNHNFARLSRSVQTRMTLENDDKINGWSVGRLHEYVLPLLHDTYGISVPIVFDSLHWEHGPRIHTSAGSNIDADYETALDVAVSTWKKVVPMVHHSQSIWSEQQHLPINKRSKITAHSNCYTQRFHNPKNHNMHIMLEAKEKEIAALNYLKLTN